MYLLCTKALTYCVVLRRWQGKRGREAGEEVIEKLKKPKKEKKESKHVFSLEQLESFTAAFNKNKGNFDSTFKDCGHLFGGSKTEYVITRGWFLGNLRLSLQ